VGFNQEKRKDSCFINIERKLPRIELKHSIGRKTYIDLFFGVRNKVKKEREGSGIVLLS
jgi:hypothetical protein